MPAFDGGWPNKDAAIRFLQSVAGERACPSCYYPYFKGYLTSPERHSVKATSKDCWCDLCDREGKKEVMMVTEQ